MTTMNEIEKSVRKLPETTSKVNTEVLTMYVITEQ